LGLGLLAGAAIATYAYSATRCNENTTEDGEEEKSTANNANNKAESKEQRIARIKRQAQEYIEWEPYETFRQQVQAALSKNDVAELEGMFGDRISFGTAGLRSMMHGGYAFMNDLIIIQTTQGLIRYIESQLDKTECREQGVIIGYDARHHSDRFAKIALSIFLDAGFKIYWFNRFAATPFIPFGILKLKCCAGIVVTASHNPKLDNGFKVYWNNGSQIIPPHDEGIAQSIKQNLKPWHSQQELAKVDPFDKANSKRSQDITDLVTSAYFKECSTRYSFISDDDKKENGGLKVTFTPMHGIGGHWMTRCYEAFALQPFIKVPLQHEPDPEFSTVEFPNPEEGAGALKLSMQEADKNGSTLILANDPDSDRLAVAEKAANDGKEWYIYNGNEIAVLLSNWYFTNYMAANAECDKSKLCMIASTVSSKYLQSMADKEGFVFVDTLTGFKWMGNTAVQMIEKGFTFLFAYEVEIGFLIGDTSFDKDGIRCAAIFNEMAIQLYKNEKKTCLQKLHELRAKYGFFEMTASYRRMDDASLMQKMRRLRNWSNDDNQSYPPSMAEFKIKRVRDVTTGYDSGEADKKSKLPIQPNQQMITFWFDNGATATIRNSGTEPKLKFYVETKDDKDPQVAKALLAKMTDALLKEFMQME